jgi:predicted RNA binding protein YcfA (HicA-like mRNA interferase family)
VTYSELTRKLRELGCVLKRQARGSHEIWHNPRVNRTAVIPNHSGDIPLGTLRAIL